MSHYSTTYQPRPYTRSNYRQTRTFDISIVINLATKLAGVMLIIALMFITINSALAQVDQKVCSNVTSSQSAAMHCEDVR